MRGIHWHRVTERARYKNGEENVLFWFVGAWLSTRWQLRFDRWRHDGLPRRTLCIGPVVINYGKDHYWTDAEDAA